jgi:hypothetical protein
MRNPSWEGTCQLVARFGQSAGDALRASRDADPDGDRALAGLANLIQARHTLAHRGQGTTATLADVRDWYDQSHRILDWVQAALTK